MTTWTAPPATGRRHRASAWWARMDTATSTYYLLLWATVALVSLGLVMVLSASAVTSYTTTDSPYTEFKSQAVFAAIGALGLVIASRLSVRMWQRLAVVVMAVGIVLQLLVFSPLGVVSHGNKNWIALGPFSGQPSEVIKVGLALFGGAVLTRKRRSIHLTRHVLVPYLVPVAGFAIALVLVGHDLGTVLVLGAIVAAVLWAAGVPAKFFALAGGLFAAMAIALTVSSANRTDRIKVWLGQETDPFGVARQPIHGRYALADGGWLGLGLGESREKWGWLPEAHNDYIFAIIGEELGLPGTLVVLLLFAALAYACFRLVQRSPDMFVRITTAGIMAWISAQAMVNIGTVIGLLPVIGVPLPLVSSGGSSIVTTMVALGILLSFARAEPGCAQALRRVPKGRTIALWSRGA